MFEAVDSVRLEATLFTHHPNTGKFASDLGARAAYDLALVRYMYSKADEVYRMVRVLLLRSDQDMPQVQTTEWIPLSDH